MAIGSVLTTLGSEIGSGTTASSAPSLSALDSETVSIGLAMSLQQVSSILVRWFSQKPGSASTNPALTTSSKPPQLTELPLENWMIWSFRRSFPAQKLQESFSTLSDMSLESSPLPS